MSALVVWLVATAAFWFAVNFATNIIEDKVHEYAPRAMVMAIAGLAIGAVASAVGYTFLIVAIMLLIHAWFVRRRVQATLGLTPGMATKYAVPSLLLIVFATLGSYVFSLERCDPTGSNCRRVFFERIYDPPQFQASVNQ